MNAQSPTLTAAPSPPASPAEFEARLRQIGAERYHDKHPFHELLHSGGCTIDQVRAWVINRWMYQSRIPMKDAAFLSRVTGAGDAIAWASAEPGDTGLSPADRARAGIGYVPQGRRLFAELSVGYKSLADLEAFLDAV